MARLKKFILEIHRRSLWQVLAAYIGASWFVMEATDQIVDRYLLPEWVYPAALILLLIGLPIVFATALVREERREPEAVPEIRDPTLLGDVAMPESPPPRAAPTRIPGSVTRHLTWPRAILGGVLAFTGLGLVSALIVLRGTARVTEAYGAAGDAFEEREWILVTDFEAPQGEEEIALAAREALTIDLQQSQYVNLFGRDHIAPVLRRMERPDTARLDRQLALEVAEREGLAAVLVGRVSRLGEDYVFGARIVQPGTREELIAVRSAARADRLLEGVESLSREIRGRLGEEREAIRSSRPLPEVTTRSLAALKIYSQAVEILERNLDQGRAIELALEAVRLDSTFAMAYRLAAVTSRNVGRQSESAELATRAFELRDRLPERERVHVEADYYSGVTLEHRRLADVYELHLSRYPDDDRASNNLGVVADTWLGEYERAYQAYLRALQINPYLGLGYGNTVSAAFAAGYWEAADSVMDLADERGFTENVVIHRIGDALRSGDLVSTEALCDSLLVAETSPALIAQRQHYCGSIDIARGRISRGLGRLAKSLSFYADRRNYWFIGQTVGAMVAAEQMRRRPAAAASFIDDLVARFPRDSIPERDRFYLRTNVRTQAALVGRLDLAKKIEETYPADSDYPEWLESHGEAVAGAAIAVARGDAEGAMELLSEGTADDRVIVFWQTSLDMAYGLANDGLGEADAAVAHLEAAINPAVLARWWQTRSKMVLPFVLIRLAEIEESRGNTQAAIDHYQRFLELWSDADPEVRDQVTSAQRALARLTGAETN